MALISSQTTIRDYQHFIKEVYGVHNNQYFSYVDLCSSLERFCTKVFRAVRKGQNGEAMKNAAIVSAWLMSIGNQANIDVENELVTRYPGVCQKCNQGVCVCGAAQKKKTESKKKAVLSTRIDDVAKIFAVIYPAKNRTLEQATLHLAEKMGELTESISAGNIREIKTRSADFLACLYGVTNSLGGSFSESIATEFAGGCHVCGQIPCRCSLSSIIKSTSVL